jgi:hypothetical protein
MKPSRAAAEEEVPTAQLPAAVTAAVKAQYPAARIVKGEKVTRGATVSYSSSSRVRPGGRSS